MVAADPKSVTRRSFRPGPDPTSSRYEVAPFPAAQVNVTVLPETAAARLLGAAGPVQPPPTINGTSLDGALTPPEVDPRTRT